MHDGFDAMVEAALDFFPKLSENNHKSWFEPQKNHYKSAISAPAKLFSEVVGEKLAALSDQPFTPKVFRLNRDVRFSKDKTPYNMHLHLSWQPESALAPAWIWGLSPEYFILGLGLMRLEGGNLARFRAFVDADGEKLKSALGEAEASAGAEISVWGPEPLKRVPKPYAADHPHGDLLKRKSFAVTAPIPHDWRRSGIVETTLQTAGKLQPLYACLSHNL